MWVSMPVRRLPSIFLFVLLLAQTSQSDVKVGIFLAGRSDNATLTGLQNRCAVAKKSQDGGAKCSSSQ